MSRRLEKINSLLKSEIAKALLREIDVGNSIVTITNVKTIPDLTLCRILISVMPEEKEKEVIRNLKRNVYDVQKIINKRLRTRPVPRIRFEIDEGIKNLYKIDEISSNREG